MRTGTLAARTEGVPDESAGLGDAACSWGGFQFICPNFPEAPPPKERLNPRGWHSLNFFLRRRLICVRARGKKPAQKIVSLPGETRGASQPEHARRTLIKSIFIKPGLFAVIVQMASWNTFAAFTAFTGGNGSQWQDPANWTNGVPDINTQFQLPDQPPLLPFPVNALIDNYSAASEAGAIGRFSGELGRLFIQNGGSLANKWTFYLGEASTGELFVYSGGSFISGNGNMFIGYRSPGVGRVLVSGTGASLTIQGLFVGEGGNGTFTVEEGGRGDHLGGAIFSWL